MSASGKFVGQASVSGVTNFRYALPVMNLNLPLAFLVAFLATGCDGRSAEPVAVTAKDADMPQPDDRAPDAPMDTDQQTRADALTPSQLEAIDRELLRASDVQWRKVARVVGTVMMNDWSGKPERNADVFYAHRVARLVRLGRLEAQGDLTRMRFSEVRLR
jgi:hypothetical protein